ncbi:MAG: hypothetical protein L6R39_003154 [Caloplaca ligustica]|nr:MAG: hypothetical protein L6R39_003154 [Caloplaca ligustica]
MYQVPIHPDNDPKQPPTMRTVLHIQPELPWASLAKYRNFTLNGESLSVHQYALISRFQPLPKPFHPCDRDLNVKCIARILEIRALDPQNVYVRVYWLYRPEDIPGGRRDYHGSRELISTNHMEIVDALRVLSPVQVFHWKEEDKTQLPKEGVYWRQKYNIIMQEVSTPLHTCTCNHPINPERSTIQCNNNPNCSILLHEQCLINAALQKLNQEHQTPQQETSNSGSNTHQPLVSKKQPTTSSATVVGDALYAVHIVSSEREKYKGKVRYRITDLTTRRSWEQDIECLKCGAKIR